MYCLDATFLIDYLNEEDGGPTEAFLRANDRCSFAAPTVALYEVSLGALLPDADVEVTDVRGALDWIEPLPLTETAAAEAARIETELMGDGSRIKKRDVLIAAVVREAGGTIVTRDEHFDRVEGLSVEFY